MRRQFTRLLTPLLLLIVLNFAWYWFSTPQPAWFEDQPGACAAVAVLRADDVWLGLDLSLPISFTVDDALHPPRVIVRYQDQTIIGVHDPAATCDLTLRQAAERIAGAPPFFLLLAFGVGAIIYVGWLIARRARKEA